ncbi:ankyrin repeat-containing domain protein [Trichoderma chlorosporum]
MLYSFRALTNTQLKCIEDQTSYGKQIEHKVTYTSANKDLSKTVVVLAGLAATRQHEIQFSHPRLRSFLISQAENGHPAFKFATKDGAKNAHLKIAIWCIEIINKTTNLSWEYYQTDDEDNAVVESREDFLCYAIKYWVQHTVKAEITANGQTSIRELLENQVTLESWAKAYWSLSNPATRGPASSFSPLVVFAENNAEELLDLVLKNHYLQLSPAQILRAMESAARANNSQIVHYLQTMVTTGSLPLDDFLLYSFASQNPQLIQNVVRLAEKNPGQLRNPLGVLGWAAFHDLEDAVDALIPLVPEENINEISKIPVQLALRGASVRDENVTNVISKLSAAASGDACLSNLQKACELGVYEAISIFIKHLSFQDPDIFKSQAYPNWLYNATKKAIAFGHNLVLKELLDLDAAKGDDNSLISILYDNSDIKVKCYKEIVSRLDLKSLGKEINNSIKTAITFNAVSMVQHLLKFWTESELKPLDTGLNVVEILIKKGFEICHEDKFVLEIVQMTGIAIRQSRTKAMFVWFPRHPLYISVWFGREEIVRALLDLKADPNRFEVENKVLEMLLRADNSNLVNSKDPSGRSALLLACEDSPAESVKVLLKFGAKIGCYVNSNTELSLKAPLLHYCQFLSFNFDVDERDKARNTALHYISRNTTDLALKCLVQRGASPDTLNEAGETPLLLAVKCDNYEATLYLLSQRARVNMRVGQHGSALLALIQEGAYVNFEYSNLYDSDERDSIIKFLLDTEEVDLCQVTSRWAFVERLIKGGAKVDDEDEMGRIPIHFALYRTLDHVQLLEKHGANFDKTDLMKRNALHFAVASGRLDVVKHVLDTTTGLVQSYDIDHWTPLMWAMRVCGRWGIEGHQRLSIIQELLRHGTDPKSEGKGIGRIWTAYDLACYYDLGEDIIDSVEPTLGDIRALKKRDLELAISWAYRIRHPKKKGVEAAGHCDACLMALVGVHYKCYTCLDFCLCFKCYRSKNTVHSKHDFYRINEEDEFEQDTDSDETSEEVFGTDQLLPESIEG